MHGFWHTVTYKGWRKTLDWSTPAHPGHGDTGLPFVSEQRGTAALQHHFLLATEKRAAIMKQRLELAKILWDSTTIGTQRTGEGFPCKKVCIRMISKESATFSGGSGETLEDLTEDLTQRIDTEHPSMQEGVQAILRRKHAARSKESRDMSIRKAMVAIGAKPEEQQPLACILLGSLSGVHEYTVAMIDTGCAAYQVAT